MFDSIQSALNTYLIQPIARDPFWELTALVGEIIFGGRFLLQWIISEYRKKSHVPIGFWYMSIVGTLILMVYFTHKKAPVMLAAFSAQLLIYFRNLQLIYKERKLQDIASHKEQPVGNNDHNNNRNDE